jgi:3-oxoacyl-[acyl-carrier-protein] synthase-3
MGARILGVEYHLPEKVETLEDLAHENPDWDLSSVAAESGIRTRHIAAPNETTLDLGYVAARKLLDRGLAPVDEIDFLLYCTQTPDHFLPAGACILQDRLKLGKHIGAFDFDLGCSGFVYGLLLAKVLIESEAARHVLLIAGDTSTKHLHPRDRMLRILFGDAASATLIGKSDQSAGAIGQFVVGTNGAGAKNLIVPAGGFRIPRTPDTAKEYTDKSGSTRTPENLFMDGPAVFTFAITTVPRAITQLLQKANLKPEDVDFYIYHQANKFMLQQVAQRSKIPESKVVLSMEDIGNTSSASIPIAIQRYVEAGRIRPGHRLVLVGFGVGYSWAACDMIWG